jgi:hypothetical protein
MRKRKRVSRRRSRKDFRRNASRTHVRNILGNPMRGGIRL